MDSPEERKRRLEKILFPDEVESVFDKLEREVEELEASVERPPVPVVPIKVEKPMEEKKENGFDAEAVKKNSLRVGLLLGIIAWLGVGGWAGAGCYGCSEGGNAVFGAIGFVLVGVLSAFLIGVAGASITAFAACWKAEPGLDGASDLFEEVCWEDDDVAIGAIVLTVIGCLLALGILVGAFFSLIEEVLWDGN